MKASEFILSSIVRFNIILACIVGALLALLSLGFLLGWF